MKTCLFLSSLQSELSGGKMRLIDALDFAAQCGFDAVEFYPVHDLAKPDQAAAAQLAAECSRRGLDVVCFSMVADVLAGDEEERVAELSAYADVSAALGAPFLHHTIYPHLSRSATPLPRLDEALPRIARVCRAVIDYAASRGVTCLFEEQGYLVNGREPYARVMRELPQAGVVIDSGNIYFADEPLLPIAADYLGRIRHVHIKDYLYRPAEAVFPGPSWYRTRAGDFLRGTIVGHGMVPLAPLIELLLRCGYDGCWSIEFDGPEKILPAVAESLANLRRLYREATDRLGYEPRGLGKNI